MFATLSGTVIDSSGAVIPAADVSVKNANSGDVRKVVSSAEGFFNVSSLPAGTYDVEATMKGFTNWKGTGIVLNGGDSRAMTITLAVAVTTTTVEVTETVSAVALQDTGEKSALISSKDLQDLSLISRNATEFVKILPGAVMQANGGVNRAAYVGETIGINGSSHCRRTPVVSVPSQINGQSVDITQDGQHVVRSWGFGRRDSSQPKPRHDFGSKGARPQTLQPKTPRGRWWSTRYQGGRQRLPRCRIHVRAQLGVNEKDAFNKQPSGRRIDARFAKVPSSYYYPGGNIGGPLIIPGTGFNKSRQKVFFFEGYENYHQDVDGGVDRAFVMTPEPCSTATFAALSTYGDTVGRPPLGSSRQHPGRQFVGV